MRKLLNGGELPDQCEDLVFLSPGNGNAGTIGHLNGSTIVLLVGADMGGINQMRLM